MQVVIGMAYPLVAFRAETCTDAAEGEGGGRCGALKDSVAAIDLLWSGF
jgi:hypothetical protein